jgi:hypothetical protein
MLNVHIHAECPYFSIFEIVPEKKAVSRLIQIKNQFLWYDTKSNMKLKPREAKLVVKTGIHNPTLF